MNKLLGVAAVLSVLATPVLAQQYGTSALNGQMQWNAQVGKATADAERTASAPAADVNMAAIQSNVATDAAQAPKAKASGDYPMRATAIAGFR